MADKRQDYITWDDYFMGVALLAAERSKDPNTQVGACIVNDENRILTVSTVDGTGDLAVSVSLPRVVGSSGVVATLMPRLDASESAALRRSGRIIRKNYDTL